MPIPAVPIPAVPSPTVPIPAVGAAPGETSDLDPIANISEEKAESGASVVPLQIADAKKRERSTNFGLDPRQAGWASEVVAEQAKTQLKRLAGLFSKSEELSIESVADLVSADLQCGPLRPAELVDAFTEPAITVRQAAESSPESELSPGSPAAHQGPAGLVAALAQLATPLVGAAHVHVHVKIIDVAVSDEEEVEKTVRTTSLFEASGQQPSGLVQQRAKWSCRWQWDGRDKLRLVALESQDYQQVETGGPWLPDCTQSALGHNRSFHEQLKYGLNHWLSRIESVYGISFVSRFGIATGDINGDGLEDIYVCQPAALPNRLYVQQPDGTATDRSAEAGVDWLDHTTSALLVDLDNDGDQDLVAATVSGLLAFENDSTGQFEERARLPPLSSDCQSLSAADYD